jgi:hypothetical protein
MDQNELDQEQTESVDPEETVSSPLDQATHEGHGPTPGDVLRTLPTEAQERGTRFISAQAMQAKLFSVYDAAAAAEDALALVQYQLTLTLNRSYYDADEIESMAAQLDSLLALETIDLELDQLDQKDQDDLVSND